MAMSEINTFMSHGAVNEDAESSERERGAWSVVAWSQRDGSGNYIGARARPFAATSVPLCGARTYDSACAPGWRTVSTGDIQDSPRRACTIARLFSQQRFVPKRNCHPRSEEVLDLDAARAICRASCNLSGIRIRSPAPHEVAASVWITGCGLRAPNETGVQGERRRCP